MVSAAPKLLLAACLALGAAADAVLADATLFNTTISSATNLFSALDILNATLGGRVHAAVPFEKPCFSTYEGKPNARDNATCAAIQANYTDPTFRVQHFGAYMLVRTTLPTIKVANSLCFL